MQIKGTVTHEVVEVTSTVCNACGETKPDTTHVHASGGYSSTAFFDMRHYEIDLCEECLVSIMVGLKIPPTVSGESDDINVPLTWERDRASFEKSKERDVAEEQATRVAVESGVCAHRTYSHDLNTDQLCGSKTTMRIDYGRGLQSVCTVHGIDMYTMRHCIIERDDVISSFGDRARIGSAYLRSLLENSSPPNQEVTAHVRTIYIATCFPLLMQPKWATIAMRELHRLTDAAPKPIAQWTNHRLPHRFAPGDELATRANAWLAWGRDQGYLNATAHGFIGCNATCLWTEEDLRDSADDV